MNACSRLAVSVGFTLILAAPVSIGQPYTLTWDPGETGFTWHNSANWAGPSSRFPDDDYDRAVFNTAAGSPEVTRNIQGNHGGGLGQLSFETAGWSVNNEPGEDYTMYLNSVSYFSYNAIYSRGNGVNAINTLISFVQPGQNIYTGTGNTLVIGRGFTGSYGPVISSINPTAEDTGAVRLDAASSSLSGSFYVRQGTLLVRNSNALGTSTSLNIGGDQWVANDANARLLTDAPGVTISQNITVRTYPDHEVKATLGGHQTSGGSAFSGTITLNRDASLTSANTDANVVAFNNTISGTGGITKIGSGTVALNHANSYAGPTTINTGTLRLGAAGALPSGTAVTLANVAGAVLDLYGYNQTISSLSGGGSSGGSVSLGSATLTVGSGNYAGSIGGTGGLTKAGAGTLALSGANSYSGATMVNGGTLRLGAAGALPSGTAVTLANVAGAVLDLYGYNQTISSLSGGGSSGGSVSLGSATLTVGSGNYTGSIGGTGGLTKTSAGSLALGAANTFSGDTRIREGTLTLNHALALQNSTVNLDWADDGTLNLNDLNATLGGLMGARDLAIPRSRVLTVGNNSVSTTYGGRLTGTGVTFTKSGWGTLTLTGNSTFDGTTRVENGVLALGDGGTSGWISTPVVNNSRFRFNRSDDVVFAASIEGKGQLEKQGIGKLTLTADNSYAGETYVESGTLLVNGTHSGIGPIHVGSAVFGGTGTVAGNVLALAAAEIAPGESLGTLVCLGDVRLAGKLRIEIDGAGAGSSDSLRVGGVLDIAGANLELNFSSPADDYAYVFAFYGVLRNEPFAKVLHLPAGYRIDYNYEGKNQIALVVPEPPATAVAVLSVSAVAIFLRRFRRA